MKLIDTTPFFLNNYEPSIPFLRSYYAEYPDIFEVYFSSHCKDTDERHTSSIEKYPQYFSTIKEVHQNVIPIIKEVTEEYSKLYQVTFPIDVHLIVGGFGSNAYTYRQIIPNITFALEKLSPDPDHLRVIVAHEFGHAAQNILTDNAGMDWTKAKWNSPLIWSYREGVATHFSRKIAPGLHPSIYFSYNDEGKEWLDFANENANEIKSAFAEDYQSLTTEELYREWFSINGGNKFGYSRLAYFIGEMFFQEEIDRLGEIGAIIAWKEEDFEDRIKQWLLCIGDEAK
ncbi:hypothetical protein AN964_01215 [Heyndrickxia shackletonii]|uniref:Aminopeptidase n=1 Tax=Heyndrickxia shackletonii TaxID=157838 RepID=A0A0Q3TFA0_9BACI|nr:hypothetical protein [Heyndrickxia shackletonii]KQL52297.1 hypothetical protein AN964_01215 [Heyndrickxia shackletonii]NEZ00317.1 hypothetical protein [Heyndrickxia shackletonii]